MADAKKRGWRWSFVPRRLIRNERFLALSPMDSSILLRLYLACTGYGRFECGFVTLKIQLGIIDPDVDLFERVRHLEAQGFVHVYEIEGETFGQISRYDDDAPADLIRKRGSEILPACPALSADCLPNGCQPSAQSRSEEIREEKKRARVEPYRDE
jgi:hypothetical protein